MRTNEEIIEFLKLNSTIDSISDCWIYNGPDLGEGYTYIQYNYRQQYVHRVSAHIFHGLDLSDKTQQANHKSICKNRKCWNPEHIYVGIQSENINDKFLTNTNQKGIFGKALQEKNQTHCLNGHEFTTENTYISKGHRTCKTCSKIRSRGRGRVRGVKVRWIE